MLYDDNKISIEDDTDVAFSEDVAKRYEAYGWHVQIVDWTNGGTGYVEDVQALWDAYQAAEAVTDKPSFIVLRTIIAWPAPTAQNTGGSHGSALGDDEIKATKKLLGFDPDKTFIVDDDVIAHTQAARDRGKAARDDWQKQFDAWATAAPEKAALLERLTKRELPDGWDADLPTYEPDEKGVATRVASGDFLSAAVANLPELWGGSADLAGSNNTTPKGEPSFLPPERSTAKFTGDWYGRVLHFGIREHAMGAIMNGMAQHGLTRPYGGTFLVFSDYMRPSVRLAALQELPVTYVWTHDSIGLGEDGPTHQPVEHLAALRAIPGLDVIRPADANETIEAWRTLLGITNRPAALALSRQNLPTFPRGTDGYATADNTAKGAYTLLDTDGTPDVILFATGSEVQLAVKARELLAADGIQARVVSMPSREWFEQQDEAYRNEVIPPTLRARVSVEAGIALGWRDIVGDAGRIVSLEHFGASADYATLYDKFGITAEAVVAAAKDSIAAAAGEPTAPFHARPAGPVGPGDNADAPNDRTDPHEGDTMNDRLKALADAGVSIWLDDLSRERIETGNLKTLIDESGVVGVTTNPSIFASALAKGEKYEPQVKELKAAGADVDTTVFELTTKDVHDAAEIFKPVYDATGGADGRVSIEVEPGLARDTDATIAMAKKLWDKVGQPNTLIKIPATVEGLPAIAATTAAGISVNVTLIFSLDRYRGVMDAYLDGLEQADAARQGPLDDPLRRVVLRQPRRLRGRQAPPGRQSAAWQGRHRQRASRLRGLRGGLRIRSLQGSRRQGRQCAASALGVDRRQGSRLLRHALCHRARGRQHRQHDAREDAPGVCGSW